MQDIACIPGFLILGSEECILFSNNQSIRDLQVLGSEELILSLDHSQVFSIHGSVGFQLFYHIPKITILSVLGSRGLASTLSNQCNVVFVIPGSEGLIQPGTQCNRVSGNHRYMGSLSIQGNKNN